MYFLQRLTSGGLKKAVPIFFTSFFLSTYRPSKDKISNRNSLQPQKKIQTKNDSTKNYHQRAFQKIHSIQKDNNAEKKQNFQPKEESRPLANLSDPYWQQLLPRIQKPAQQLISLLLEERIPKHSLLPKMQSYLEFRVFTFLKDQRTDLGCMGVLMALRNSSFQENMGEYETRIIDFLTLSGGQLSPFDGKMIHYFMKALCARYSYNLQKNIKQHYKLRYCQIILGNLERMNQEDLPLLLNQIIDFLKKQTHNFVAKWRFFRLVDAIQEKTTKLIKQFFDSQDFHRKKQISWLLNNVFLQSYTYLLSEFEISDVDHAKHFYAFLMRENFSNRSHHTFQRIVMYAINNIPYIQIGPKGETFRQLLLRFYEKNIFTQILKGNPVFQKAIPGRYLLQKFFQDSYFAAFKDLPFEVVKEKYLVVKKGSLKKPLIDDFIWRIFKQRETYFLEKKILNDVITQIYPQKISPQTPKNVSFYEFPVQKYENESNFRVWEALNNLGYTYEKEPVLCQRSIDIVINGNILLEIDGQGHNSYLTKEVIPQTGFRNYHLMLRGYKLVTVSIYEYMFQRSTQELQQLLKEKIELAEQEDIVFVS